MTTDSDGHISREPTDQLLTTLLQLISISASEEAMLLAIRQI